MRMCVYTHVKRGREWRGGAKHPSQGVIKGSKFNQKEVVGDYKKKYRN